MPPYFEPLLGAIFGGLISAGVSWITTSKQNSEWRGVINTRVNEHEKRLDEHDEKIEDLQQRVWGGA